ncbi:MAG: serine/threonine protein kinase [Phycisphaerales bacterium]|nr:serine/threonine protein kinase [Phycisphaerales bacterium]
MGVDFGAVATVARALDDSALAEVIEADGRMRLAEGLEVDLARYIEALPNLVERTDALDAAIDVALRSIAGGSRAAPLAVEKLIQRYPQLAAPIREAATLSAAVWSTTGLRDSVTPPPSKPLPCDFGAIMPDGRPRYVLQALLGQGAFGQVYLALDRQLSEEGHTALVAIKILVRANRSPWARQRMIEEATKVRRISHPNVVQVIDRGVTEQDEDYIVYEYVDGGDLGERKAREATMPAGDAARLVKRIALGAHAAHLAGVIHCDLKPGNIMLTGDGQPKIADFGIAVRLDDVESRRLGRGLQTGSGPVGNLAFIAPEQYRGEDASLSAMADVYAIGGILYYLMTGCLPNGSTLEEIASTHDQTMGRTKAPSLRAKLKNVDRDLDAVCQRALAAKAQDRHSSAAALAEDLDRWLKREPIPWTKPGVFRKISLWSSRKPALAGSLAAIVLLFFVGLGLSVVAAVNKAKADQKKQQDAFALKVASALVSLKSSDYRINTEMLPTIWVLEYVFGPTVLGIPDAEAHLWKARINRTRQLMQAAHERGRHNDKETLDWETALGFWLVCDKDYAEAQPLLKSNYEKLARILAPDDEWLGAVRAMLTCAEVNRYSSGAAAADATELRRLEAELSAASETIGLHRKGTPIHFLLLRSTIDLYRPALLNQPERQSQLEKELQELMDASSPKRVKEAASASK